MMNNKYKAAARLLEMTVRAAFAPDALRERHLSDWPTLRYFSQVSESGRTQAGLANFLGISQDAAAAIVARLLDDQALVEESDAGPFSTTPVGRALLSVDPIASLCVATESLDERTLDQLVESLQRIHDALKSPPRERRAH